MRRKIAKINDDHNRLKSPLKALNKGLSNLSFFNKLEMCRLEKNTGVNYGKTELHLELIFSHEKIQILCHPKMTSKLV